MPVQRALADADKLDVGGVAQQPSALRTDVERRVIGSLAGDIAALYLGPRPDSGYRDAPDADAIAREALAKLGPRLAELVIAREESDDPRAGDEANAWGLASALAGPDAGPYYLEWLRAEARELVRRYDAAILRVADALERHAVLSGDQVAALIHAPRHMGGSVTS